MSTEAERWNQRYEGRLADAPEAPLGLDPTTIPAGGLFVDVACGLGAQAVWAAQNGFEVVALDVSEAAVGATMAFAMEHHVDQIVDARVHDLSDGMPRDLVGLADVLICQHFREPSLYPELVEALAPGGTLVVRVMSPIGAERGDRRFVAGPGELVQAFSALDVIVDSHVEAEGWATLTAHRAL